MQKVIIGRSRIKTFLSILAAIGFVVIGIWMITIAENEIFLKIMGGISALFFGAAIPIGIKKLITGEPALELTSQCLIIEPESSKNMVLPWKDILGFEEIKISGTKIIIIKVKDPQGWISKEPNTIKKKLMQFNNNNYESPFNTSSSGLSSSHKQIMKLLNEFLEASKG